MPRIVTMIASATEIVCALGFEDQLVARSHECDWPPSVKRLPVCTAPRFDVHGSSAEIDQRVLPRQRQPLRHGLEEFSRIRRPELFVEFGCSGEASHGAPSLVGHADRFHLARITSSRPQRDCQTCWPPLMWISAPFT